MFRIPGLTLPSLPFMGGQQPPVKMVTAHCKIDGRTLTYGVVEGDGPTVLLIHGWGLSHRSYVSAAEALGAQGFRVLSPDLPGFGASKDLPYNHIDFPNFAGTLRAFVRAARPAGTPVDAPIEPVHVVGHSFGGAVAVQFAHDDADIARSLVLVDAASGSIWSREGDEVRLIVDRPIWDWGLHLLSEFPLGGFPGKPVTVLRDLAYNAVRHPFSMGMVAHLIRHSDVHAELEAISARGVPISVVWANGDRVVTRTEFEDQCKAAGCAGTEVKGNHGWLINDPKSFGATLGEVLTAIRPKRRRRPATSGPTIRKPAAAVSAPAVRKPTAKSARVAGPSNGAEPATGAAARRARTAQPA